MCGIAGIYNFKEGEPEISYIQWCLNTMKHRGPDSSGIWHNSKNYLAGFVRLAIRDLTENGSQPMLTDCGNYCISFNGEIYNTEHLARLLRPYRSEYKSSTDTELLLYALVHLGINKTLAEVNGIFAFAFYDVKNNQLLLARDRMGIKPLYIGYNNEGLVYSSQYDHIINHAFCAGNAVNTNAVELYMCLGYVPEGTGMINNTQLVPHGHYVLIKDNGWKLNSYYSYPVISVQAGNKLESVLEKAVYSQLISDVPLGTFMSGGVDSTLVTGIAAAHHRIKSFTIGLAHEQFDETDDAAAFAGYFNTQHENRHINETDLLNFISKNTKAFSEPFADFSSIPALILSGVARKQVTVALSGDGGDELFWGYPRNAKALNNSALIRSSKGSRYYQFLKQRLLRQRKTVGKRHLKATNIIDYYYQSLFIPGASISAENILEDFSLPVPYFLQEAYNTGIDFNSDVQVMNIIRKMEMDMHLQRILIKVDRAGMYNSLEIRVPLLDNTMLDYSAGVDYRSCIINNDGKANLKKVLASKTNAQLVYKRKKGFDIPMREWLNTTLYKDVQQKLMEMPTALSVYFDSTALQKMLKQHRAGEGDYSSLLWAVYTLVLWQQEHCGSIRKYATTQFETV